MSGFSLPLLTLNLRQNQYVIIPLVKTSHRRQCYENHTCTF
uniref:Uncharacterized protein n=1 Tax=Myoviridae sp. ctzA421 TaxID=2826719 RepID=A0A8S5LTW5_9CAUD|nr:MAG TPA: hypothetical protein [Myoviridae sp. ctzA421]